MFGWITQRYREAIAPTPDRSRIVYMLPEDSRDYLDSLTRREIVRRVEWLAQNFGVVKEGVRGIARHAVGKGIALQLNTSDLEWNAEAEAQFEEYALTPGRVDMAGRRNFYEMQLTAVEQRVLRGEFFASVGPNPRWDMAPAWQLWDTNEICTPDRLSRDEDIFDGIRLDQHHNPIEYYVESGGQTKYSAIPAAQMVHWYAPSGINQVRGESDFAPSINRLVDWHDLEKLVVRHAKTHSALAIVVNRLTKAGGRGAFGAIRRANPGGGEPAPGDDDTRALEKAFGGAVAYLGENGKAELVTGQSPNDKLEPFISNLLLPNGLASLGLPVQIFWSVAKMGGPETRFRLAQADLTFALFADGLIYRFCNPVAYRFIQNRIATGMLREPRDKSWSAKMSWQTPARITVDNGRDGALELQQLANGVETLRNICDRRGISYRSHMRQWIREILEFVEIANEEKVPQAITMRWLANMPLWRAHATGAPGLPATVAAEEDDTGTKENDE